MARPADDQGRWRWGRGARGAGRWQLAAVLLASVAALPPLRECRADEALELQLMSFNIRFGTADDGEDRWARRRELVFDYLRRRAPDVAGLQEALRFQIDEILAALPAYRAAGVGRDDGQARGEHSSVLYRADRFELASSGTFWLSDTPETIASTSWGNTTTRICTWVRLVEKASRRGFHVYNVHLDHQSQPSRERSVELVARRIAGRLHADPAFLLGDFNAGEGNAAIRFLASSGWADTFRRALPEASEVGTFHAFTGRRAGEKIDFIFTPAWVRVLDAAIDREGGGGRHLSDHYPVTARVAVPLVRES